MEFFSHLENFEEQEDYWGLEELKWNWKVLFAARDAVKDYIDESFPLTTMSQRRFKVMKCMEFKTLAEAVMEMLAANASLEATEERLRIIKELAAAYQAAVLAYYGIFKVNIQVVEDEEALRAIDLPMGPWVLFSRIQWQQWVAKRRLARVAALVPSVAASNNSNANRANGNVADGGLANEIAGAGGLAANGADVLDNRGAPPRVGLPVDQEVDINQNIDEMKHDSRDRPQSNSRPRRVSFQDDNRNRNRERGRDRERNQNSDNRDPSRSRSRDNGALARERDRIAASFDDDIGFDDIDINDRSSAV